MRINRTDEARVILLVAGLTTFALGAAFGAVLTFALR